MHASMVRNCHKQLPARNRPDHNKRLLPRRDSIGKRRVGQFVGKVFLTGEKAQERTTLLCHVARMAPRSMG